MADEGMQQSKQPPVERTDGPAPGEHSEGNVPPIGGGSGHNEASFKPAPTIIQKPIAPKVTPPPEPAADPEPPADPEPTKDPESAQTPKDG